MKHRPTPKKPGPKPEHLTIKGDWTKAIGKAIKAPPPKPADTKKPPKKKP